MEFINLDYKGKNKGHYSAGVISNGMLYISGQLSVDPETRKVCEGGIKEHSQLALANMDRVLKEAGLEPINVVQCRIYISDIELWDAIDEVYRDYFGEHMPARIVVPVKDLHFGCMVEIEAIAEIKK